MLNWALAVLSGVLLVAIHPRLNWFWLAPFAIAPLLYALAREWRPKRRFVLGYISGVTFWAGICHWIQFVMSFHGGMGDVAGAGVFALFFLMKGLQLGVFGLLAGVLIQHRYAIPAIAALWVAIERIPGPFFFTWLLLGNAGIEMAAPLRLAPYTGVYGLSFVFAAMGCGFAWVLLRRPRRPLAVLLGLLSIYALPALPDAAPPSRTAVSLQPNIEETTQWTTASVLAMQGRLEDLTVTAARTAEPQIVLWPEVPAPLYYYSDAGFRERVSRMARTTGASLLIGTVAHNERGAPLNAAVMLSPAGELMGRYDKMFLVPFGEYVPFPFGFAHKISTEIGDFAAGERIVLFPVEAGRIGAFICYESAFPHLVRRFAAEGATVYANLSNDGYFGGSAAREQHLSLVRMRAVENRRWVLRSTNDGITASIDPAGRIVHQAESFRELPAALPFDHVRDNTLYSRYGDWFAWSCALAATLALLLTQRPHFNRAELQARRRP